MISMQRSDGGGVFDAVDRMNGPVLCGCSTVNACQVCLYNLFPHSFLLVMNFFIAFYDPNQRSKAHAMSPTLSNLNNNPKAHQIFKHFRSV